MLYENKVRDGKAECYITISAVRFVLHFTYSTHGNALTYMYC